MHANIFPNRTEQTKNIQARLTTKTVKDGKSGSGCGGGSDSKQHKTNEVGE